MPDEEPVVWPEDPAEGDAHPEEPEPPKPAAAAESDWPATFEEALKQSQAVQEQPAASAEADDHPTQPSMPAISAKTVPPEPAQPSPTQEVVPVLGVADEAPTSTFKTPIPAPAEMSAANGSDVAGQEEPAPTAAEQDKAAEPTAEAEPAAAEAEPAAEVAPAAEAEPAEADEPAQADVPAAEPMAAAAEAMPEPEPEPAPASEPDTEPAPEPAKAPEPEPAPEPARAAEAEKATGGGEWIPMPTNPAPPSWAPTFGAATSRPAAAQAAAAPAPSVPGWAPSTSSMAAASRQQPTSSAMPAAQGSKPPVPPAQPAASPAAEASKPKTSSWEVVQQKQAEPQHAYAGPSPEDKSYAEWFAWAKRSGAPASACHAAAQGAFRALAAGHDMNTAVQWATLAMAQPPGLVSASRQLYCAWYSLGNIDLKLPTPQAHAFATGSIAALEGGADAPTAHQAGLAAAGITAG